MESRQVAMKSQIVRLTCLWKSAIHAQLHDAASACCMSICKSAWQVQASPLGPCITAMLALCMNLLD